MLFVMPSLLAAMAYSSDVIFGKMALDSMPLFVFVAIICIMYTITGVLMLAWDHGMIVRYFAQPTNRRNIAMAMGAITVGTVLADVSAWYAYKLAKHHQLPVVGMLISIAPLMSLLLVALFYGVRFRWQVIIGMLMAVTGICIALWFSK
jgi:drug/metabolite transporter (DMT)-like permease